MIAPINDDKRASFPSLWQMDTELFTSMRLDSNPLRHIVLNSNSKQLLFAFNEVAQSRTSQIRLITPFHFETLAILHCLACLQRMPSCDEHHLTTLLYPWNRNSATSLREILIDRECLCASILGPLSRIRERTNQPWARYVMSLQTLRSVLDHNKKSAKLRQSLVDDPALQHPNLFELFPQMGLYANGRQTFEKKFLARLRRYTWQPPQIAEAVSFDAAPFYLVGIADDLLQRTSGTLRELDAKIGGRFPNVLLLDLTLRRRRSLEGGWKARVQKLLETLIDTYAEHSPSVLAVTDDVFTLQELRFGMLKDYDETRSDDVKANRPVFSRAIINIGPGEFDEERVLATRLHSCSAEVFGTDGLRVVEKGIKLRRELLLKGETNLSEAVARMCLTLNRLLELPGSPQLFSKFLHTRYEGLRLERVGQRYDHVAARSELLMLLDNSGGGLFQTRLHSLLSEFDAVVSSIERLHPGGKRFDQCLRHIIARHERATVILSSSDRLDFVKWRFENDPFAFDLKLNSDKLTLKSVNSVRSHDDPGKMSPLAGKVILVEPTMESLLIVLANCVPPSATAADLKLTIIINHASAEQLSRKLDILIGLEGLGDATQILREVVSKLKASSISHISDIRDLSIELQLGTSRAADYTGQYGGVQSGPLRTLVLSGGARINVFDGSEIPVFQNDVSFPWSKRLASQLRNGDEICVFSPELVESARAVLKLSTHAPELLATYHSTVAKAASKLPGRDMQERAEMLRSKMLRIAPTADLPSASAIRRWIEVEGLASIPRDQVRPHAPKTKDNYDLFMHALGIKDFVAGLLWEEGVFGTRSARIKSGAFFHQLLMAALIDPERVSSRLPQLDHEDIWKVNQVAEDYIDTVIANEAINETS